MNEQQANLLLTKAGLVDGRQPSAERAMVWAEVLAEVSYEDGLWALREFHRTSTEWVMPAHLIDLLHARRTREEDAERRRLQLERPLVQPIPISPDAKAEASRIFEQSREQARRDREVRRKTA